MFVVHSESFKGERPLKHPFKGFTAWQDAICFAQAQVDEDAEKAIIYEVTGVDDARKAVAAVEMGECVFISIKFSHLSELEQKRRDDREFDRALNNNDFDTVFKILGL
jgi:hypothetical protein